jgi:hypothetical protein
VAAWLGAVLTETTPLGGNTCRERRAPTGEELAAEIEQLRETPLRGD